MNARQSLRSHDIAMLIAKVIVILMRKAYDYMPIDTIILRAIIIAGDTRQYFAISAT